MANPFDRKHLAGIRQPAAPLPTPAALQVAQLDREIVESMAAVLKYLARTRKDLITDIQRIRDAMRALETQIATQRGAAQADSGSLLWKFISAVTPMKTPAVGPVNSMAALAGLKAHLERLTEQLARTDGAIKDCHNAIECIAKRQQKPESATLLKKMAAVALNSF